MNASQFRHELGTFIAEHLAGKEKDLDQLSSSNPSSSLHEVFKRQGLANWWLPKDLGGQGISLEDSVDIVADLAYVDAGFSFSSFISILSTSAISIFGTQEQKQRFLVPMIQGGGFSAMLGSEHEAGSELLRIKTIAKKEGPAYVVSGHKSFSTNTGFAEFLVIAAACADEPNAFKALIVPKGTPGITVERQWPMIGVRASSTFEVLIEDCAVPADCVLDVNGLRVLEVALNFSRILMGATAIGVSRRIRDLSLAYAHTKPLKGATLMDNSVFNAKMGQMEMTIDTMVTVCRSAARECDAINAAPDAAAVWRRTGVVKAAIVAKMICGQLGWQNASVGSEMFGGLGYTEDLLAGKLLRDVRYISIVEGGDDVCRDILFSRFVKPKFRPPQ